MGIVDLYLICCENLQTSLDDPLYSYKHMEGNLQVTNRFLRFLGFDLGFFLFGNHKGVLGIFRCWVTCNNASSFFIKYIIFFIK